jgi:hypothetical protein
VGKRIIFFLRAEVENPEGKHIFSASTEFENSVGKQANFFSAARVRKSCVLHYSTRYGSRCVSAGFLLTI